MTDIYKIEPSYDDLAFEPKMSREEAIKLFEENAKNKIAYKETLPDMAVGVKIELLFELQMYAKKQGYKDANEFIEALVRGEIR